MAMGGKQSNPVTEVALAAFVIILICILLIEVPTWVINFSISFNITLGIVLLMISLYVNKPLELAAFPSILLIGTVFRLVLSIASTRLILAKGDAGEVVEAFGNFVTGGNMVVGGVIFLIITGFLAIFSAGAPKCNIQGSTSLFWTRLTPKPLMRVLNS